MESLLKFLNDIRPLSPGLRYNLTQMLKEKKVTEGDYILKEGNICNKICFVEKGLFGCFYLAEKNDVASWFMKKSDVFISVTSFFLQEASWESIVALEDSVIWYITYQEYIDLKDNFPEFDSINGALLQLYYLQMDKIRYMTFAQSAKRRCQLFFDNFPELAQVIPDKHAAAFLGMEPSTFSRSKKKFLREYFKVAG